MRSTNLVLVCGAMLSALFSGASCGGGGEARGGDPGELEPSPATAEAGRDAGAPASTPPDAGSSSKEVDSGIEPGPPAVQLVGRFDTRDAAGPTCAWPGCRIVARFDGTDVSVRLREIDEPWMLGGPSEWDVAIDGAWRAKIVTAPGTGQYAIASGLPPGVHTVELYKRSEAQNGATQLLGLDFAGGALLAPPKRRARRIEIIGDSQPAAFGVEGVGSGPDCPGEDHAAMWQNFRRSFGARLGEIFDAEVAGTVYSGKGVAKNIWHYDDETMPILYERALPLDRSSAWDPSRFVPHVVVLMLGGNDFAVGKPVDLGPATLAQFVEAYHAFLVSLRAKYPHAFLLLTVSPSVTDEEPAGRASRTNTVSGVEAVASMRNAEGDANVAVMLPGPAAKGELTGCNGHGNPEFHARVAEEIAGPIRAALGW